ncbi:MAG: hypothetical protein ABIH42_03580 [Planctomycetota bacterium]
MEVKCGKCGHDFIVSDSTQETFHKCPKCGAEVLIPRIRKSEIRERPRNEEVKNLIVSKHKFISPLETGIITGVFIIVCAVIIWKAFLSIPTGSDNTGEDTQLEAVRKAEMAVCDECKKTLTAISGALQEYKKKNKVFPPDLNTLKEVGLLSSGIMLSCPKAKYIYLGPQAEASINETFDPIILCDSACVHLGGRNIARASGSIEFMVDNQAVSIISEMEREYEKLLASRSSQVEARRKREQEADSILLSAQKAENEGQFDESVKLYKKLQKEFSDTDIVTESKDKIEEALITIQFRKEIDYARKLIETDKIEKAKAVFDNISKTIPEKESQNFITEQDMLNLLIEGASLSKKGDFANALSIFSSIAQKTASPFWKKIAHEQSQKIETYCKTAEGTYNSAQTAEKDEHFLKALALYLRVNAEYSLSKYAAPASSKVNEIARKTDYGKRFLPKEEFVNPDITACITAGLAYLASVQQPDGSWKIELEGQDVLDSVGVTGLALLAFIGEGHTTVVGTYKEVVSKSVGFLTSIQQEDGLIGNSDYKLHRYSHAVCTLALCEIKVLTEDSALAPVCEKAVNYILKILETGAAWKLTADASDGNTQLSTWMLLALLSAKRGGISYKEGLLLVPLNHFNKVTDEKGRANYSPPQDPSKPERQSPKYQSMLTDTACVTFGRLALGISLSDTRLKASILFLRDNQPNKARLNYMYYFFGAAAKFQIDEQGYKEWLWPLKSILLSLQLPEGDKKGSWDIGQYADIHSGRIGETAFAIMALQVPYHHFCGVNRREAAEETPVGPKITITLKDNTQIKGRLVSEDEETITIAVTRDGKSAQLTMRKSELNKIERTE